MISRDPSSAPQRTDLGWIRHRSLRQASPAPASRPPTSTLADLMAGRVARPSRSSAHSSDLDLSAPAATPPAPAATPPAPAATPPAPTAAPPAPASPPGPGLLDLFPSEPPAELAPTGPPAGPPAGQPPSGAEAATASPVRRPVPRVASRGRVILTTREPTVTLNRVQSGVGMLAVEAACSPAVGDLGIGALYQLTDGTSSVLQRSTGLVLGPPGSRRPVLTASRGEFDQIHVDLRQTRTLQRLLVYAQSESGRELQWGGTLVTRTFGGARVELPLDFGSHHGPVALMSLYNIDGEFVLRAEVEKVPGSVRDVSRWFGYDHITWADDQRPVV